MKEYYSLKETHNKLYIITDFYSKYMTLTFKPNLRVTSAYKILDKRILRIKKHLNLLANEQNG